MKHYRHNDRRDITITLSRDIEPAAATLLRGKSIHVELTVGVNVDLVEAEGDGRTSQRIPAHVEINHFHDDTLVVKIYDHGSTTPGLIFKGTAGSHWLNRNWPSWSDDVIAQAESGEDLPDEPDYDDPVEVAELRADWGQG